MDSQMSPTKSVLSLVLVVFCLCPLILCRTTFSNFKGDKPESEIAILSKPGFRFWFYEDKNQKPVDEMRLDPGEYLIGFLTSGKLEQGAAFCTFQAGKQYSFKVYDRQYLPKSGTYALKGKCLEKIQESE